METETKDLYKSKTSLTFGDIMDFAITKVSTKGQVVIPKQLRRNIKTGDSLLIVSDNGRIILKKIDGITKDLKEDISFAEEVEKAWDDYSKGRFETSTQEEFLKKLKKC